MRLRSAVGIALAATVFALLVFVPSALHRIPGYGHRPAHAAGVAAAMAILWLFEALPIWLTACIPLVAFPLLGVFGKGLAGDARRSVEPFFDAYVVLYLGGMALGAAMEAWSLHRRIALHVMRAIGTSPRRLLLGVIVATASLSLWISNTATAVMMAPIGKALVVQLGRRGGPVRAEQPLERYGTVVMLAVAYAANIGGIGTKIGTGTNSIFCGFVRDKLGVDIGFLHFVVFAFPFVVLMVPVVWAVLWIHGRSDPELPERTEVDARRMIDDSLAEMGPPSREEQRVAAVFAFAALLWIVGDPLRSAIVPHVAPFAKRTFGVVLVGKHYEATVAVLAVMLLVVLGVLRREAVRRIPWGTLLLLGGSFAMAAGIEGGGLGAFMAERLAAIATMPLSSQVLIATAGSVALTAVASNTATINVALNVLPRSLPVLSASVLASSTDFALPAGTPPNAIVFGSGYVRLPTMMRIGVVLDLVSIVLITAYVLLYARHVL